MKRKILKAIKNGNHLTMEIISAIGAELQYIEFGKAIAELQLDGKVVYNNGYYLA